MPRSSRTAFPVPAPPFVELVQTSRLDAGEASGVEVRVVPDEAARARIAQFLGIEAVERMTMAGRLIPQSGGAWQFRGQLTATVVQSCVVTLEPVRSVIDTPVRRGFVPGPLPSQPGEVELGEDDLDAPDMFDDTIDLGQLAVESLALALDPWPRSEGAELPEDTGGDAATADGDARVTPFASLAELRARLTKPDP